jgi:metal-sulfur cluster biosynthetic enzyme
MSENSQSNRPTWDAEQEYPELCESLRQGLGEVVDPELGLSVVQLGLIRNLTIEKDSAILKMILTTPFCPYGPSLLETTRVKAEEVLKIPTAIDFGLDMWDFSMMEEGAGADWGIY